MPYTSLDFRLNTIETNYTIIHNDLIELYMDYIFSFCIFYGNESFYLDVLTNCHPICIKCFYTKVTVPKGQIKVLKDKTIKGSIKTI